MKSLLKWFGIIALVAVIGFSMLACDQENDENTGGNGSTNGGSGVGEVERKITIKNDTSVDLGYLWIKPSTSTDWGSSILSGWSWEAITSGQSREITLSQSLSAHNNFDIQLSTSYDPNGTSGSRFIRYNVPVSDGFTVIFTNSNLQ